MIQHEARFASRIRSESADPLIIEAIEKMRIIKIFYKHNQNLKKTSFVLFVFFLFCHHEQRATALQPHNYDSKKKSCLLQANTSLQEQHPRPPVLTANVPETCKDHQSLPLLHHFFFLFWKAHDWIWELYMPHQWASKQDDTVNLHEVPISWQH